MDEHKHYRIDPDLIVREEDGSLFSLSRLQVYRFNEDGFAILREFVAPALLDDVSKRFEEHFAETDAFFAFVDKAIAAGILVAE